jgi:hypothetical protein
MTRRRLAAAAAAALMLALTQAVPAMAADARCSGFDPATRTARITLGAGGMTASSIFADREGELQISDADVNPPEPGCAPMSQLDTVVIDGRMASIFEYTYLSTRNDIGPLGPGVTDEPGASDELEFDATGLSGGVLAVDKSNGGTFLPPAPSFTVLGGSEINMNPEEADGIDSDLVVGDVLAVAVQGDRLADRVDASGGTGTPPVPFTRRVFFQALAGDDEIVGGSASEQVEGGPGDDRIFGEGGGDDRLAGEEGRDRISGGAGRDYLFGGPGADRLDGGPGRDECYGEGGRTTFIDCELRRR